jgi:hypothetical protein
MVKKLFITLSVLLICSTSHAAFWIKHNNSSNPKCVIGDGVKVGAVASYDTYDTPLTGWIRSDITECEDANGSNKKLDLSIVSGSRVVDMTQAELDAIAAVKAQAAIDAENAKQLAFDNDLDGSVVGDATMTKVDARIDAISSFAELKAFLKVMTRHIYKNQSEI